MRCKLTMTDTSFAHDCVERGAHGEGSIFVQGVLAIFAIICAS